MVDDFKNLFFGDMGVITVCTSQSFGNYAEDFAERSSSNSSPGDTSLDSSDTDSAEDSSDSFWEALPELSAPFPAGSTRDGRLQLD